MDGLPDLLFEAFFQIGARDAHGVEHLFHLDAFAGIVANVMHRLNHGGIVQRPVVGGASLNDAHRRDQLALQRERLVIQQPVE